jgi:hypothetical protein
VVNFLTLICIPNNSEYFLHNELKKLGNHGSVTVACADVNYREEDSVIFLRQNVRYPCVLSL